jgi:hypothetical protein
MAGLPSAPEMARGPRRLRLVPRTDLLNRNVEYPGLLLTGCAASPSVTAKLDLQDCRPGSIDVCHQFMAAPFAVVGMVPLGEPEIRKRELLLRYGRDVYPQSLKELQCNSQIKSVSPMLHSNRKRGRWPRTKPAGFQATSWRRRVSRGGYPRNPGRVSSGPDCDASVVVGTIFTREQVRGTHHLSV